jgi:hypothetical protein
MRRFFSPIMSGAVLRKGPVSIKAVQLSRSSSSISRNLAEKFLQDGRLDTSNITKVTFSYDAATILKANKWELCDDSISYLSKVIDNSKDAAEVLHYRFLKPEHRTRLIENLAHNQDVVLTISGGFVPVDTAAKLLDGKFFTNTKFGKTLAQNVVKLSSSDIAEILAHGKISDFNLQLELLNRIDNQTDLVKVLIRGDIQKSIAVPLLDQISFDNIILLLNETENASFASELEQLANSKLEQALKNYQKGDFKKDFKDFIDDQVKNHVPVFELNLLKDNLDKDGLVFRVGELTGTNPNFDSNKFQEFCYKFEDYVSFEKIAKLCHALNLSPDDLAELSTKYNIGDKLVSSIRELSGEVKNISDLDAGLLNKYSRNIDVISR